MKWALLFAAFCLSGCTLEDNVRDVGRESIETSRSAAALNKDYMCHACRIDACAEVYWRTPEEFDAWVAICKPSYPISYPFGEQ